MLFLALDPAGAEFEFISANHRLDSTDAKCVEVIHSSGGPPILGGFGIIKPVGHVEIYANGINGANGKYLRHHPHCAELVSIEQLISGNLWHI